MSAHSCSPAPPTIDHHGLIKVTVIYEDFASGTRARRFADSLAAALGAECRYADSFWRMELLDFPDIGDEAARCARDNDFLIVSLSGDATLSCAAKRWIEAWLDTAAHRNVSVVAMFASQRSMQWEVESTRCYLRSITSTVGVAFFSYASTAAASSEACSSPPRGRPAVLTGSGPHTRRRSSVKLAA